VLPDASKVSAHVDSPSTDLVQRLNRLWQRLLVARRAISLRTHARAELRDNHTPSRLFWVILIRRGQETWAPNMVASFSPYDWPLTIDEARASSSPANCLEITTDLAAKSLVRIRSRRVTRDGTWFRERGDAAVDAAFFGMRCKQN